MKAFPLILSSPSGGGKTSIAQRLLRSRSDVGYSVSVTTRPPRPGEVDGREYHFWTQARFVEARERGEFAESAMVHANLYGTLKSEIEGVMARGRVVILDIDVQGARQLAGALRGAVSVFVLPPSAEVLVSRLGGRQTENSESFRLRLENAASELLEMDRYDYVLVNDDLDKAVATVAAIIDAEGHRLSREPDLDKIAASLIGGLERELGSLKRPQNQ